MPENTDNHSAVGSLPEHKKNNSPENERIIKLLRGKVQGNRLKEKYRYISIYTGGQNLSKTWYVEFEYWYNDQWNRVKRTGNVNRNKSLKGRLADIKLLRQVIEEELQRGWNPITKLYEADPSDPASAIRDQSIEKALYWALDQKKLPNRTRSKYKSNIKYFWQAAKSLGYEFVTIRELRRAHIKAILPKLQATRNLSNRSINAVLETIHARLNDLIEHEVIESNPASHITKEKNESKETFLPPTDREFEVIKAALKTSQPGFQLICDTVYSAGIREVELCRLKVSNVNCEDLYISLADTQTKNSHPKKVPITQALADKYRDHIKNSPPDFHVFSRNYEPGTKGISRNTASHTWKVLIKDHHGIEIDLYSLKTRGNDDAKRLAKEKGIKLTNDALSFKVGHKSKRMLDHYLSEQYEFYHDEIRNTAPALL